MPPLERLRTEKGTAPVFGPAEAYAGSPLEEVGRQGLFNTHQPKTNKFAVLANGDVSFAARVQLLEAELFYEKDLAYSRRVTPEDAKAFHEPTDALYKLRKEFGGLFEPEL